jgi:hypothetical protein
LITFAPTFREVTHRSQKVRLHLLHKNRAGDLGWNLQNRVPAIPIGSAVSIGGGIGGASVVVTEAGAGS